MARQWFANGVQVYEDGTEEFFVHGMQINEDQATGTTCTLSGTATGSIDEADVVAGGDTIILDLVNDTWVADGATFNAQRQNILDGISAAASPANGWNDEWRDKEAVTAVVRSDNDTVTITMSDQTTISGTYDISAQETITATIPASALVTSDIAVEASPTFTIDEVAVSGLEIPIAMHHYMQLAGVN